MRSDDGAQTGNVFRESTTIKQKGKFKEFFSIATDLLKPIIKLSCVSTMETSDMVLDK